LCQHSSRAGVNFTNILLAAFAPKSFRQKIANLNCKHIKGAKKLLFKKSAHKILVKLAPDLLKIQPSGDPCNATPLGSQSHPHY
jgi:hypothetical protein